MHGPINNSPLITLRSLVTLMHRPRLTCRAGLHCEWRAAQVTSPHLTPGLTTIDAWPHHWAAFECARSHWARGPAPLSKRFAHEFTPMSGQLWFSFCRMPRPAEMQTGRHTRTVSRLARDTVSSKHGARQVLPAHSPPTTTPLFLSRPTMGRHRRRFPAFYQHRSRPPGPCTHSSATSSRGHWSLALPRCMRRCLSPFLSRSKSKHSSCGEWMAVDARCREMLDSQETQRAHSQSSPVVQCQRERHALPYQRRRDLACTVRSTYPSSSSNSFSPSKTTFLSYQQFTLFLRISSLHLI